MILLSKSCVVLSFIFYKDCFYGNQPYFCYYGSNIAIIKDIFKIKTIRQYSIVFL